MRVSAMRRESRPGCQEVRAFTVVSEGARLTGAVRRRMTLPEVSTEAAVLDCRVRRVKCLHTKKRNKE